MAAATMRARSAAVQARYSACCISVAGSLPACSLAADTAGSKRPKAAGSAANAADSECPSLTRSISRPSVAAMPGFFSFSRMARSDSSKGMPASSKVAKSWLNKRSGKLAASPAGPVGLTGSAASTNSGGMPSAAATPAASAACTRWMRRAPARSSLTLNSGMAVLATN